MPRTGAAGDPSLWLAAAGLAAAAAGALLRRRGHSTADDTADTGLDKVQADDEIVE